MNINNLNIGNSNLFSFRKQNNNITNPNFGTKEKAELSEH